MSEEMKQEHAHHDHEHHDHEHHEHPHHEHDHEHHHHEHDPNATPAEELVAMMRYMVGHNAAHIREMAELAESLKEDHAEVYAKVTEAVEAFSKGNETLETALKDMEE